MNCGHSALAQTTLQHDPLFTQHDTCRWLVYHFYHDVGVLQPLSWETNSLWPPLSSIFIRRRQFPGICIMYWYPNEIHVLTIVTESHSWETGVFICEVHLSLRMPCPLHREAAPHAFIRNSWSSCCSYTGCQVLLFWSSPLTLTSILIFALWIWAQRKFHFLYSKTYLSSHANEHCQIPNLEKKNSF